MTHGIGSRVEQTPLPQKFESGIGHVEYQLNMKRNGSIDDPHKLEPIDAKGIERPDDDNLAKFSTWSDRF